MVKNVIILLGPPGAGKGVQARRLAEACSAVNISSGDLLRSAAVNDPELKADMDSGTLVPSEDFMTVVAQALKGVADDTPIIADGMTRKPAEVAWFIELLRQHGRELKAVIVLDVPREETDRRAAARGRGDDGRHSERWRHYLDETAQSIQLYREAGLVRVINGLGSEEEVTNRILAAL